MSWLTELLGTNMALSDKDIALDMMAASKTSLGLMAKALTETTNPELRKVLNGQLTSCINKHHRLADIAISKGWYKAYETPENQLKNDVREVELVTR